MSGRLDQSLDSIIDSQKKAKRETRRRKVGKPSGIIAPVGGVKKATRPAKSAIKPTVGTSFQSRSSKIVVSGLPYDVNEAQIKEYFGKSVGNVKKVSLQYNQTGQSRGIADIMFSKPDTAAKAAKDLNGMLVDKRPMKIEVVVDASHVPAPAAARSLADRVAYANPRRSGKSDPLTKTSANPPAQPKSATATKNGVGKDATKGRPAVGKAAKPKRGRTSRPKPKTAEELDAEMTDYWGGNNPSAVTTTDATAANGAAPATNAGEDAMEEIS